MKNHDAGEMTVATVTVDIESAIEDVWDALTTDQGVASWMGEGAVAGVEVGAGVYFPDVVTGRPRHGRISLVDELEQIGYTWWPEDDPSLRTDVAITIEPTESGTRVTVTELAPRASAGRLATATAAATASWLWRTALLTVSVGALAVSAVQQLA